MNILSKRKVYLSELPQVNSITKTQQNSFFKKEEIELKNSINNALVEWRNAVLNFELADSPEMVEFYTYKIKACEIRYQFLLKKIKAIVEECNCSNI